MMGVYINFKLILNFNDFIAKTRLSFPQKISK